MSLSASQISLQFARAEIISRVDIDIEPGKIVTVLGPNGAGKSSLLRILCGQWAPSVGQVRLDGQLTSAYSIQALARTIAVMPQYSTLNFAFSAAEVVALGRTPHATGRQIDREITRAALSLVDADHLASRLYPELSGGEKQRVQLARILAQIWTPQPQQSRYLLLDEPTSSFDLAHQQMMVKILRRFAADGVGILVVMHDLNLAAQLADRMVLMKDGRIAAADCPAHVMQTSVINQVFDVDVAIINHPRTGNPMALL
ncbi:MAG: heme ABC transporter ATP-binding protein [Proteobacteria bacterium]|nr:heme ABC transporter ATP-binding protein [Pseudomonadota bacterium]